jgi:CheY-like chemotaxis protein
MPYILIVDDDGDFAAAVRSALESRGYEAAVETVAERALPRIRERCPDAVVLDVMFPEDDAAGFEVARSIRRQFGALPVLLLTAVNRSYSLGFSGRDLDASWLPAADFLEKPVDLQLLCERVSALVAGAEK